MNNVLNFDDNSSYYLLSSAIKKILYILEPSLPYIRKAGDILQILLPVSGLVPIIYNRDNEGFYKLLKCTIVTSFISHSLKFIFNHTLWGIRPNGKYRSFPSAHTSSAFSGASFISMYYGSETAGNIAYGLACFTGISRVVTSWHHVRDIVVGAMIGYLVSYYFIDENYNNIITI